MCNPPSCKRGKTKGIYKRCLLYFYSMPLIKPRIDSGNGFQSRKLQFHLFQFLFLKFHSCFCVLLLHQHHRHEKTQRTYTEILFQDVGLRPDFFNVLVASSHVNDINDAKIIKKQFKIKNSRQNCFHREFLIICYFNRTLSLISQQSMNHHQIDKNLYHNNHSI